MNSEIQNRLLRSVYAIFVPMAQLMLRYGITFEQFSNVAKEAFVRVALAEKDAHGRGTNTSRVSVKTGISRKEVSRIRVVVDSGSSMLDQDALSHSGPPAKVLHAWHSDPRFSDGRGSPRALEFDGSETSFAALVRAVAGDVPAGAVRAELRKAEAISDLEAGRIIATKRFFVPGSSDEKAITALSGLLFPLMAGIEHNSRLSGSNGGYIQRFAYSDSLPAESIPAFRNWSRTAATSFVEAVDDWLAENETRPPETVVALGREVVGIGVYYYQGPTADDVAPR